LRSDGLQKKNHGFHGWARIEGKAIDSAERKPSVKSGAPG